MHLWIQFIGHNYSWWLTKKPDKLMNDQFYDCFFCNESRGLLVRKHVSNGIWGFEDDSKLHMWKELLDLCGELFFNQWRYVRDERKVEKNIRLWRKNTMIICCCMGWKCRKKKATYVSKNVIIERVLLLLLILMLMLLQLPLLFSE